MATSWIFAGLDEAGRGAPATEPCGPAIGPDGRVAMVSGDASVRQALMLLLATLPGERVMRPDYGCPLHRIVFAPNDATTAGLAIHYVRQAVRRFEPRVDIMQVEAGPAPDSPAELHVTLTYRVRDTRREDSLDLRIDLTGGSG
jgi:uncharacterized protein